MAGVIVSPRSRVLRGHDWVFRSEIRKVFGEPRDGEEIELRDSRGGFLGSATYSAHSHICARRFSRRRQPLDRDFFLRRISMAWEYRERSGFAGRPCRAVWSESDGLPGLIVDRYGAAAVLQTPTAAMDSKKDLIAECVMEVLGVRGVIERNDFPARAAEGLPAQKGFLAGEEIREHRFEAAGARFLADLLEGQKTGFYLDQIPSYEAVARHSAGRRVLDCFSNQGGFALACAKAGAAAVVAVESGEEAAARLEANAKENGLAIRALRRDVFQFLRAAEKAKEPFDLIVLDPPSFSRGKSNSSEALRGYRELHLRAAGLLSPNGLLATFCCSHHVGWNAFLDSANAGFLDAQRSFRLLRRFDQPPDHPVLPHLPETEYLKGMLLEALPAR